MSVKDEDTKLIEVPGVQIVAARHEYPDADIQARVEAPLMASTITTETRAELPVTEQSAESAKFSFKTLGYASEPQDYASAENTTALGRAFHWATTFGKGEPAKGISEESLPDNNDWLKATATLYLAKDHLNVESLPEFMGFKSLEKLSPEILQEVASGNYSNLSVEQRKELSDWGLDFQGQFNWNIAFTTLVGGDMYADKSIPLEAKTAFLYMMDTYDQLPSSWEGAKRAAAGVVTDPTTYAGLGIGKAIAMGSKEGVKHGLRFGLSKIIGEEVAAKISQNVVADNVVTQTVSTLSRKTAETVAKNPVKSAASFGATYAGLDALARQWAEVGGDRQKEIDLMQLTVSSVMGAGFGVGFAKIAPAAVKQIQNLWNKIPVDADKAFIRTAEGASVKRYHSQADVLLHHPDFQGDAGMAKRAEFIQKISSDENGKPDANQISRLLLQFENSSDDKVRGLGKELTEQLGKSDPEFAASLEKATAELKAAAKDAAQDVTPATLSPVTNKDLEAPVTASQPQPAASNGAHFFGTQSGYGPAKPWEMRIAAAPEGLGTGEGAAAKAAASSLKAIFDEADTPLKKAEFLISKHEKNPDEVVRIFSSLEDNDPVRIEVGRLQLAEIPTPEQKFEYISNIRANGRPVSEVMNIMNTLPASERRAVQLSAFNQESTNNGTLRSLQVAIVKGMNEADREDFGLSLNNPAVFNQLAEQYKAIKGSSSAFSTEPAPPRPESVTRDAPLEHHSDSRVSREISDEASKGDSPEAPASDIPVSALDESPTAFKMSGVTPLKSLKTDAQRIEYLQKLNNEGATVDDISKVVATYLDTFPSFQYNTIKNGRVAFLAEVIKAKVPVDFSMDTLANQGGNSWNRAMLIMDYGDALSKAKNPDYKAWLNPSSGGDRVAATRAYRALYHTPHVSELKDDAAKMAQAKEVYNNIALAAKHGASKNEMAFLLLQARVKGYRSKLVELFKDEASTDPKLKDEIRRWGDSTIPASGSSNFEIAKYIINIRGNDGLNADIDTLKYGIALGFKRFRTSPMHFRMAAEEYMARGVLGPFITYGGGTYKLGIPGKEALSQYGSFLLHDVFGAGLTRTPFKMDTYRAAGIAYTGSGLILASTLGLSGATYIDDYFYEPDIKNMPALIHVMGTPGRVMMDGAGYGVGAGIRVGETIVRNTLGNFGSYLWDGSVGAYVPYRDKSVVDYTNDFVGMMYPYKNIHTGTVHEYFTNYEAAESLSPAQAIKAIQKPYEDLRNMKVLVENGTLDNLEPKDVSPLLTGINQHIDYIEKRSPAFLSFQIIDTIEKFSYELGNSTNQEHIETTLNDVQNILNQSTKFKTTFNLTAADKSAQTETQERAAEFSAYLDTQIKTKLGGDKWQAFSGPLLGDIQQKLLELNDKDLLSEQDIKDLAERARQYKQLKPLLENPLLGKIMPANGPQKNSALEQNNGINVAGIFNELIGIKSASAADTGVSKPDIDKLIENLNRKFQEQEEKRLKSFDLTATRLELGRIEKLQTLAEKITALEALEKSINGSGVTGDNDPRSKLKEVTDLLKQKRELDHRERFNAAETFWKGFSADQGTDAWKVADALPNLKNYLQSTQTATEFNAHLGKLNDLKKAVSALDAKDHPDKAQILKDIGENSAPATGLYAALNSSPGGKEQEQITNAEKERKRQQAARDAQEFNENAAEAFNDTRDALGLGGDGNGAMSRFGRMLWGGAREAGNYIGPALKDASNPRGKYGETGSVMANWGFLGIIGIASYNFVFSRMFNSTLLAGGLAIATALGAWAYATSNGYLHNHWSDNPRRSSLSEDFNATAHGKPKEFSSLKAEDGWAVQSAKGQDHASAALVGIHAQRQDVKGKGDSGSLPYVAFRTGDGTVINVTQALTNTPGAIGQTGTVHGGKLASQIAGAHAAGHDGEGRHIPADLALVRQQLPAPANMAPHIG